MIKHRYRISTNAHSNSKSIILYVESQIMQKFLI